jgi:hypothetical protein
MKIRNGFVSNSSTSSFLIYGVLLDESYPEADDSFYDRAESEMYDLKLPLGAHYFDGTYIGTSWSKVKDDETGRQFKDRVESSIKELIDHMGLDTEKLKFGTFEEAWENR